MNRFFEEIIICQDCRYYRIYIIWWCIIYALEGVKYLPILVLVRQGLSDHEAQEIAGLIPTGEQGETV
jgi:hypothetical protein